MTKQEQTNKLILALADKLYICSHLLTAAAERLSWDNKKVQCLFVQLENCINKDLEYVESNHNN